MGVNATVVNSGTDFAFNASISYPNRAETGVCQPVINIQLKIPNADDSGGGKHKHSSSSSSSGPPGPGTPGRTQFTVLVDVSCNLTSCYITKYYKKLEYDTKSLIVYWLAKK